MEIDDSSSLRVASFSCYLDTAKESLVHRVSAQDNTTMKPPISIKFSKKAEIQEPLRVDSFSRLNTSSSDHNLVFQVPGPIQDPTAAFTFSHQIPKDGGEIGVFGADRYFNMKLEYQTGAAKINNQPRPTPTITPSSCSEASSWNSQKPLLPDLLPNESQMKQKKATATRLFMGFGCRGPCFDKKSVHLDAQRAYYTSKQQPGSDRVLGHHHHNLPLPPPPPPAAAAEVKIQDLDESRRSIEVFGSRNRSSKGDVATNMERKLSMLTWDAIPKGRNLPTSTVGSTTICDDMASDASSDLFEIENISGSIYPLLVESDAAAAAAAAADDVSCCMSPTSLYAPSEASIQWSVVTASAADYSALSEFNDDSVSTAGDAVSKKIVAQRGGMNNQGRKEVQKTRAATGLLGCKSHKAVDVAQNACVVKTNKP